MTGERKIAWKTVLLIAVMAIVACGSPPTGDDETKAAKSNNVSKVAAGSPEKLPNLESDRPVVDGPPVKLSASNILVSFEGSLKPAMGVTRSEDEAKARAWEVYEKLKGGGDFATLAAEYSDDPAKSRGGRLGVFLSHRMIPEISATLLKMKEGQVSEPVRSPYGFHVIRRETVEEIYLAQLVVSHNKSEGMPPTQRTEEEALSRVQLAVEELKKPGKDFFEVVSEWSDHPDKEVGGVIGAVFRGMLPPELEAVAFALESGTIGEPVKTKRGYVVLYRMPEIDVRSILVSFQGSKGASATITRSREEALGIAKGLKARIDAGEKMADLALEFSDGPGKTNGGELGKIGRGVMAPAFDSVAFSLEVGQVSDVAETEYGFHIIERLPL